MASLVLGGIFLGLVIYIQGYNFGYNNSYTCHCLNDEPCHSTTGSCGSGCLRGWGGPSCQQENIALDSTSVSQSGIYDTESSGNDPQLVVDGYKSTEETKHYCSDTDTDYSPWQWWSIDLQQPYSIGYLKIFYSYDQCPDGFYGAGCQKNCNNRKCLKNSKCDHGTEECIGGCSVGYSPTVLDCTQECETGLYGSGCSKKCSDRKCNGNSKCDSKTGECIDGCQPGFQFIDCTQDTNHTRSNIYESTGPTTAHIYDDLAPTVQGSYEARSSSENASVTHVPAVSDFINLDFRNAENSTSQASPVYYNTTSGVSIGESIKQQTN